MAAQDVTPPTAVILTALSLEYEAVRSHLTDIEKLVHQPTGTRAERGRLPGSNWYVALTEIGEGTLTAATLTERINTWLSPQVLLFVGVAGGLKRDINIGDVVVATKVYAIHGGKQTQEGFQVRPEAWRSSHRLEQAARHALRSKAHFKPIAVGDVVLADAKSAIARHIHENYNDAVAIEMESAGVTQAAHLTGKLETLTIRGISDRADAHKHERDAEGSQSKAASNAARAAMTILRELEPDEARAHQQIHGTSAAVPAQQDATVHEQIPPGWPLTEVTDPFRLEVHHAIAATVASLPVLPTYVEREHDHLLVEAAKRAIAGISQIAVLVGGSSTGKTRACWEAINLLRQQNEPWRLWHPFNPTRPEAALAELARITPHTVVWLNEAQEYLLTPGSDLGQRVAAGLRALLHDPARGPVLVLGTIWPEYWATLTTQPTPNAAADPHAQARALLTGNGIHVPPVFTDADLEALATKAQSDPRLASAVQHAEQGQITQYLAGAPALLERYENAPPAAKTLIEAAMDARRLGHNRDLPLNLLKGAAEGYLTDTQWDLMNDDWLEQALAYTTQPLRGARGPLTRIRPRRSQTTTAHTSYRLADYLEQHGRRTRATRGVPAALWEALLDHAAPTDTATLAKSAGQRGLLRLATRLYATAAEAGDPRALEAADLLHDAGRMDDAITWCRRAAEGGTTQAFGKLATLLGRAGRRGETLEWYQRAADAGDTHLLPRAAWVLAHSNRVKEAALWLAERAGAGDAFAMWGLIELLMNSGHVRQALSLLPSNADNGVINAHGKFAWLLDEQDQTQVAAFWIRARAETSHDVLKGTVRLIKSDHVTHIWPWYARTGDIAAYPQLAAAMGEAGQTEKALAWYQRAADSGDTDAPRQAAQLLAKSGRLRESLSQLQTLAENGDSQALLAIAAAMEEAGQTEEALTWYQRAAESGDMNAPRQAAQLLSKTGQSEQTLAQLQHAADLGNPFAVREAAELMEQAGQIDEALTWLRAQADTGNIQALQAMGDAATLSAKAGRTKEAMAWWRRAADAGGSLALKHAASFLQETGRGQDAENLRRYGWEPDGSIAEPWEPEPPGGSA
ncbi:hypothetical protein [Streptomyces sp. ATE26]|uniref:phosphorylase family protein n=1 Tax=Streptomyces sp. ATE26 TaxID=2954237 RepID=UPI0032B23E6F